MNPYDTAILLSLNSFAHRSYAFDFAVAFIAGTNIIKGGFMVMLFWWVWFEHQQDDRRSYQILLMTLAGSTIAVGIARLIALLLPFRTRPLYVSALHFQLPYTMEFMRMEDWSSFPSDHMALFFGLAIGIFLVHKRIGTVALLFSFFVIGLPRVYLGIHYPTDIIAGALLGGGIVYLLNLPQIRDRATRPLLMLLEKYPGPFYAAFFLFSYEIVVLFDSVRTVLRLLFGIRQI